MRRIINEYYTSIYYTTINRQKWTQSHLIKIKATQFEISIDFSRDWYRVNDQRKYYKGWSCCINQRLSKMDLFDILCDSKRLWNIVYKKLLQFYSTLH